MSTTAILIAIGSLVAIYLLYKKFTGKETDSPEIETIPVEIQEEIKSVPAPSISSLSEKVEKIEETAEEMNKRLSSITNPDADKPFAKISLPEVSEVETEAPKVEEAPKAEEAPETPKPKRKYNKKKKS